MDERAPVHVPASSGHRTALHRAARVGNGDAVAALIHGGCAVDLQDRDGNTALHEVSWHGFTHCVTLLLKAGADVSAKNKAGNTALHLACQNAHAQAARLLLLGGSTPDAKNNMGDTCLHVAARYNNLNLAKMLLSSLCSVTEKNQGGDTALHVAAALNHKKTVQLLLEAGTDGKVRNNVGKTALDVARDNNHKEVALLLARAPQVHHFLRGRTIRKRRGRAIVDRRSQSDTRMETQPDKEGSGSLLEEIFTNKRDDARRRQHHKERRVTKQVLNENDQRKNQNDSHIKWDLLWDDGEEISALNGKTYQLYTLYRDHDGNVRQAPAHECHCQPLFKKLEGQIKATQEEMRRHVFNVQEQVNSRLVKMDQKNRHQIQLLNALNQERAAAEWNNMIYRMEQKTVRDREEALRTQAAVSHELKRWCVSHLRDVDVHFPPPDAHYYKLLPSPSVDRSTATDANLESLPLLSVVSGESSTSLANYVNILPSTSSFSLGSQEQEQMGIGTYFEMRVERSPDDYENTALFPLPTNLRGGHLNTSGSGDLWRPPGANGRTIAAVVPIHGDGFSSSSSSSGGGGGGDQGVTLISHQEHSYSRNRRKSFGELMSSHADGTRTLEFFIDRPAEPTFSQERKNLHAVEVTQRFFETVSTQMELWYKRKIVEVEQQTEIRAQQDRKQLLQRINTLEEELQRLTTNEEAGDGDRCRREDDI